MASTAAHTNPEGLEPNVRESALRNTAVLCHLTARSVDASMKSLAILERGARALHTTGVGFTCMTIEEAGLAARAMWLCPTMVHRLGLGLALARITAFRAGTRSALLSMTATEVLEDSASPLVQYVNAAVDEVSLLASVDEVSLLASADEWSSRSLN